MKYKMRNLVICILLLSFPYIKLKAQSSGILIEDNSGADVYLNGKIAGKTPFSKILNAGSYKIEIRKRHKEYFIKTYTKSIKLNSGEIKKVIPEYSIDLIPQIKPHLKEINATCQRYGRIFYRFSEFYIYRDEKEDKMVVDKSGNIMLNSRPNNFFRIVDEYLIQSYEVNRNKHCSVYDKTLELVFDSQSKNMPTIGNGIKVYNGKLYFSPEKSRGRFFSHNIQTNKTESVSSFTEEYFSILDIKDDKMFCSSPDDKYVLKNIEGQTLYNSQYRLEGIYKSELLPVCYTDHRCGYIDAYGKVIIPLKYWDVNSFSNGYAVVGTDSERLAIINTKGTIVINGLDFNSSIEEDNLFIDDLVNVKKRGEEKYGFINKLGEYVIKPEFDDAMPFSEGFAIVGNKAKEYGIINKQNRVVIPLGIFDFDEQYFRDGELLVWCNETSKNYILTNKLLQK